MDASVQNRVDISRAAAVGQIVDCRDMTASLPWQFRSSSFPRTRESSSAGAMRRELDPYVYLLASRRNGTLYVGVTSNLMQRVAQHRAGTFGGFTAEHDVKLLVWLEQHATMDQAILREKQIKKWRRAWKLDLIEQANPDWRDFAVDLGFAPSG